MKIMNKLPDEETEAPREAMGFPGSPELLPGLPLANTGFLSLAQQHGAGTGSGTGRLHLCLECLPVACLGNNKKVKTIAWSLERACTILGCWASHVPSLGVSFFTWKVDI